MDSDDQVSLADEAQSTDDSLDQVTKCGGPLPEIPLALDTKAVRQIRQIAKDAGFHPDFDLLPEIERTRAVIHSACAFHASDRDITMRLRRAIEWLRKAQLEQSQHAANRQVPVQLVKKTLLPAAASLVASRLPQSDRLAWRRDLTVPIPTLLRAMSATLADAQVTSVRGRPSNDVADWAIRELMTIWTKATGKEPGFSRDDSQCVHGPFIRFVESCTPYVLARQDGVRIGAGTKKSRDAIASAISKARRT
jgi:hypothetical protein